MMPIRVNLTLTRKCLRSYNRLSISKNQISSREKEKAAMKRIILKQLILISAKEQKENDPQKEIV